VAVAGRPARYVRWARVVRRLVCRPGQGGCSTLGWAPHSNVVGLGGPALVEPAVERGVALVGGCDGGQGRGCVSMGHACRLYRKGVGHRGATHRNRALKVTIQTLRVMDSAGGP